MNNLSQYHIIGITGIIGSGKSVISEKIQYQYQANIIEIDDIRREMLWSSLSQESVNLRKDVIQQFSITNYDEHYFFDRNLFTKFIFSHENILKKFNFLCLPYFVNNIKTKIVPQKLNCIVWVNLIEEGYLSFIEMDYLIFVDISTNKWLENNQNNLSLIQERYTKQTESANKKKLLSDLTIPYEVYLNE